MAALLLFSSPEEKASRRPPCPPAEEAANSSEREHELILQPPCTVGSRAVTKKSKFSSSSVAGQKKQPQRGLGVAQLERLRLLEQKKRLSQEETTKMLAPTRLAPLQTYGYGCNGMVGRHGRGPAFSLLDARHRHAKQLSACSSQNGRMFNFPVLSSNPGRSICQPAGQLPYSSQVLQRYKRCIASEPLDALQSFVTVPDDAGNGSNYIMGEIIHVEDDARCRGLASHFYQPHGHLFSSGRKEIMAGLLNGTEACKFQKVTDGCEFGETRPDILPSCVPFLQNVGGSKVGVPLTVDGRSKPELSSFQMFHENSNWLEPKWLVEQKNQWYAVPHGQKIVQNVAVSLDLKLSPAESNLVSDHSGDKRRDPESLFPRSSSFTRSGSGMSPVFSQKTVKPFAYGARQDSIASSYPDDHAQHNNGTRKRQRCAEEDYIAGSNHGCRSDFLALTLSNSSAGISESRLQTLGETNNSEDTIRKIRGCFTDLIPASIQEQGGGGIIDEETGPVHTYTFLAAFDSKDDDECPSLLEISSSNTASASTSATGSSRASTDATSVVYQCHSSSPPLDLSLKLAT